MQRVFAVVFIAATCLAWPSLAQKSHPKHDIPATRVGQVSPEVAAHLLRQNGFSDVANLRLDGAVYRAEASKGGARVNIEMDARSGRLLKP